MGSKVGQAMLGMSSSASSAAESIMNTFKPVGSKITNEFEQAKNAAGQQLNGIDGFAQKAQEGALSHFVGLGSKISNAIGGINFPKPHVTYTTANFAGKEYQLPHVEWYAKGGFVDGATLIGAGESGPEMILPRSGGLLNSFADALSEQIRSGGDTYIVNGITLDSRSGAQRAFEQAFRELRIAERA